MPGILPMKVIKVGTNAQTRIAQACDRCRSKKIRCDGIRPCCSQCANVGFECKTSDKLSRRAFPRGYTESLEERVRSLEAEVRELKDLLDEKDEKIDMLSRIHSQSSHPIQLPSPRRGSSSSMESGGKVDDPGDKDEIFKVQQSPYLTLIEGEDSYFTGTSSGRHFIESFKHHVQETGRSTEDIDTESLLASSLRRKMLDSPPTPASPVVWKAPSRMVSDQLINKFFQEWAPLFPILYRPAFLTLYERYVEDADTITDKAEIAQLNLVFGIASVSIGTRSSAELDSFESQWRSAIDSVLTDNSMSTLQCLVLAQIYCIQQGDLTRLLTYKGLSTTLSARLGLHQSQKRFALGTLTCETRKKVFWTLYTVDSFSSVVLGLPKHIKDEDVHCEYPVDADDEYVTERGFQPTLPGESTKLSSALALFKVSRILSKVLEEVYPAKTTYDLSLKKLAKLSDELESWSKNLAPHLRLQFEQDKPSTGTISSRSPLLSLAYHYIRALIQRPAISSSTLGHRAHSSMLALAASAKHMIQIVQLLDERGMSFSFCLNRDEVLVLSGFGLLFQRIRLDPSSKMLKDNQKMLCAVVDILDKSQAPCTSEFRKVVYSFLPVQAHQSTPSLAQASTKQKLPPVSRHNSDPAALPSAQSASISTVQIIQSSTKKQLKAIASRFNAGTVAKLPRMDPNEGRRNTVSAISLHPHSPLTQSQPSLQPNQNYSPASTSRSEPARSPVTMHTQPNRPASTMAKSTPPQIKPKPKSQMAKVTNLDYLSFGNDSDNESHPAPPQQQAKPEAQPTDWEKLLGSLDNGQTNIYDACYGGQPVKALMDAPKYPLYHNNGSTASVPVSNSSSIHNYNDSWTSDLWSLYHTDTNNSALSNFTAATTGMADSIGSSSADSVTGNADDLANIDWISGSSSAHGNESYQGIMMPAENEVDFGANWDTYN